jgi:hypothetical protein
MQAVAVAVAAAVAPLAAGAASLPAAAAAAALTIGVDAGTQRTWGDWGAKKLDAAKRYLLGPKAKVESEFTRADVGGMIDAFKDLSSECEDQSGLLSKYKKVFEKIDNIEDPSLVSEQLNGLPTLKISFVQRPNCQEVLSVISDINSLVEELRGAVASRKDVAFKGESSSVAPGQPGNGGSPVNNSSPGVADGNSSAAPAPAPESAAPSAAPSVSPTAPAPAPESAAPSAAPSVSPTAPAPATGNKTGAQPGKGSPAPVPPTVDPDTGNKTAAPSPAAQPANGTQPAQPAPATGKNNGFSTEEVAAIVVGTGLGVAGMGVAGHQAYKANNRSQANANREAVGQVLANREAVGQVLANRAQSPKANDANAEVGGDRADV